MRRLTVKERVLLHLFDYSRFAEAYEAPVETTQAGIAKAVGIRGSHVAQNVRPLLLEGLVEERLRHTTGQESRRKVYFLTPKGRQYVAALRASLLKEDVPFKTGAGETTSMPLMRVYHEERRGSSLLQLLEEMNSKGAISQVVEVEVVPLADFIQEVPKVERFYGRRGELDAVLHAIGEKPIIVVSGMAGIGKTVLGAKVCETLRGSCPLFWRQVRPWDTATDLATRLAAFLKALGRTGLHDFLRLSEGKELSRIEELLPTDLGELRAVLILDDVHQASEDAGAFLALLSRVLQTQRGTSAVLLSRTPPRFYSQREVRLDGSVLEVRLEGLDKKSSAALLMDAGVPAAFISRLAQASGGNPLFLQLFASRGAEEAPAKGWDTVAAYIAEQIEPFLNDSERDCLVAASFYEVPVPAQGLLLDGRGDARPLVGVQRKGLLGQVGKGKYVLHDTLKEYFQQTLAPERKRVLATKAVAWLSDQAEHAAEMGDPQEAVALLGNAAKLEPDRGRWASIMEGIGDLRHLMIHLAEAERAFRAALGETNEPRARARLHEKLGHALELSRGRLDEADREVDAGLALLPEDPTPEAVLLLLRRAVIALRRRDFDRADEALRRATELADRLPSERVLRGRVALERVRLRDADPKRFDVAAIEADCRTALEAFRSARDERHLGVVCSELSAALTRVGRIGEALAIRAEAVTHDRAGGHSFNIVGDLAAHAYLLFQHVGDFEQAAGLLQEKLRLAKRYGLVWSYLETYSELSQLLRSQGRFEEARESMGYFLQMTSEGELYRVSTSYWPGGGRLYDLTVMARLCARCGDVESAEAYLNQAHELACEKPPEGSAFELAWGEAAIRVTKGQLAEAEACFRRALDLPPPFDAEGTRGECMLDFGRCLTSRGDKSQAREMLTTALAVFSRHSIKPLEHEALGALKSLGP